MGIVVKHGGNAAPVLVGAFGGGQGRRYAEDGQSALDRDFRAREAGKSRVFADQQNRANMQFRSEEIEQNRQFQTEENESAFQRSMQEFDRRSTRTLEDRKSEIQFTHSSRQREEFNKLSDAYDQAVQSGDFTPDELSEIRREIIAKQAGIQPLPRMRKESPWPENQGVGQTWASDDGQFMLTRAPDGSVKKIAETGSAPTMKDIAGLYGEAIKVLRDDETGKIDMDAADEWVERAIALHRRHSGRNQNQGAEVTSELMADPNAGTIQPPGTAPDTQVDWAASDPPHYQPEEGAPPAAAPKAPAPAAKKSAIDVVKSATPAQLEAAIGRLAKETGEDKEVLRLRLQKAGVIK